MAKKRTAKFGYGKQQQRMEALAKDAFGRGDHEFGSTLANIVAQAIRSRRLAGPSVRKPAPWLPNIKGTRFKEGVRVAR